MGASCEEDLFRKSNRTISWRATSGARAGVAVQPAEVCFVIDDRQRIVQWSYAAATMTGVPEEKAIGRPCYEVVRGHDPFGRAVCQQNCRAFAALRSGHVVARCALLSLPSGGETWRRLLCELIALPRASGGAVATLSERPQDSKERVPDNESIPTFWSPERSAESVLRDLAAVTTLSSFLSSDSLEQSVEQALKWLREAADAEAAELFLVEPQGGDMLLAAYQGPFRAAFSQITRFHPGQGFPGLVLSHRDPILTCNLSEDPRYLRARVKQKGFQFYVCAPLLGSNDEVIGALNVASRRSDVDLSRTLRLLTWASRPISTVLQAGLLQAREAIEAESVEVFQDSEQDFDGFLGAVLHQMILAGHASGGALILYDRGVQGVVRRVTEGEFARVVCPDIRSGNPEMCPAFNGGHGMALHGPKHQWPQPCQQVPAGSAMVYCLPLAAGGETVGIVQLGYADWVPLPPTRYLPTLLNLSGRAAYAIKQGWRNLQNQRRTLSLGKTVDPSMGPDSLDEFAQQERRPDTRPFMEVRCFGAFELYLQGKLITSDMFQRRGALVLLKMLLIQGGRPMSRDVLAEILWPEANPEAAANRMYVLVHTLRRVVEPFHRDQRWVYICSDGDRYYFNPGSSCWLDIEEFQKHVDLGQRLERDGDIAASIDAYEAAVHLYRGDLLEDEPFAEWCWVEREHLRELCIAILGRLAAFYLEKGLPDKSTDRYRLALRIDPVREENHRGLMRSLWAAGRRDEALRQYQECQEILLRELDVAPLPETERLYHRIRSNSGP